MSRASLLLVSLLFAGLLLVPALTGCAPLSAPPDAGAVLAPPAALQLNGVPPVPKQLVARVGNYTEFRGIGLADWHPAGTELLVAKLHDGRTQLHRVAAAGAALAPLTVGAEPTRRGRYMPGLPGQIVFLRDSGGNEAAQIHRLDMASGTTTVLTDAERAHDIGPFDRAGTALLQLSVPLDRTAPGGKRAEITTELAWLEVMSGKRRVLATLPGTGWYATDVADDDRNILLIRYRSATDAEVWSLDARDGQRTRLLPRAGEGAAYYDEAHFAADGRGIFVVTDRTGEFRQLFRYDSPATFTPVTADVPWDVVAFEMARDRRRFAIITNEAGRGVPRAFDAISLQPLGVLDVKGSATGLRLAPDDRVAINVVDAATPAGVWVHSIGSAGATRAGEPWALGDAAGFGAGAFRPTEIIQWPSFDGRMISGLITRPPSRFGGKRPVLIEVHGGPESQARLGFAGRLNFLINELGLVVIEPNVRGSTGFGKTFVALDNGLLRENAVRDLGALLDWIARRPDLDAQRVAVHGGSYGGYMALAAGVFYSDRLRGVMSSVGISHFVSFLERTESYRRDLRRVEYGDERDPAMRAFLDRISPLTNAARIRAPLLVVHGRNDPRVPVQEAEQIIRTVAANGVPVWSVIADNEGHGFAKKENADYAFHARVLFLERFVLGE